MGLTCTAALALLACTTEPSKPPLAGYRDVVELFDQGIARTCSLNNGVCHNSKTYPDLHTVANLVDTVARPCNVEVTDATLVNDACEWPADHLVVPSAHLDARIVAAAIPAAEIDRPYTELRHIVLTLDTPPALAPGATDTQVQRGTTLFDVGSYGAKVVAVDGAQVTLDLDSKYAEWTAKQFFDVRVWPPGPLHLHVGDVNGNGIEGARSHPMPMLAPGDPANSYLFERLTDEDFGERMPRQCRTWNDVANQTLACWIAGLTTDAGGRVTNAYDPIDYAHCDVPVAGLGKCP